MVVKDWERVAQAFSPRRNARALWDRKADHLAPLDGIRALSILWVVTFHAAWFTAEQEPVSRYRALLLAPRMLPVWRGHFGVDVFFVLSGFLIAGMLLDERERDGSIRLGLFYVRRLLRLWPALIVAVAAYALTHGPRPGALWANALYVSNFLPVLHGAMGWTWSLSIEEHFYLVCPWLIELIAGLGARARVAAIAAIALSLCGVAAAVVVHGDYHVADSEIAITRDITVWAHAYDELYSKPWMRVGPLLAGVMAAMIHRKPGAMEALARARVLGTIGFVVALFAILLATQWLLFHESPRAIEIAFLATYRTVFGVAVAYLLLFSISSHPLGRVLGRVLGARVLYPVAQLAYSAYLLNPIATRFVQYALGTQPFAIAWPLEVLLTFVAASVVYVLVERPFMELRPRRGHDRAAPRRRWLVSLAAIALLALVLPLALLELVPRLASP